MSGNGVRRHAEEYRRSMEHPEEFWLAASALVDWDHAPTRALDDSAASHLPLVPRRHPQRERQRARPLGRGRARRSGGARLRLGDDRLEADVHLRRLLHEVSLFAGVLRNNGVGRATASRSTCR